MAFSDITDPAAVVRAVREFDAVGRGAFLARYGFGEARQYFLSMDGKLYDSKAIIGAAHGYQFPEKGPLRPTEFSRGDATVKVCRPFVRYPIGESAIPGRTCSGV